MHQVVLAFIDQLIQREKQGLAKNCFKLIGHPTPENLEDTSVSRNFHPVVVYAKHEAVDLRLGTLAGNNFISEGR